MREPSKITRPPRTIARRQDGLFVDWDGGGHEALLPARALRLACPCAGCVEEMTGRPLLDPGRIPEDVHPVQVAAVGGYGIRVQWSDGHGTGIYTWDLLRRVCPCPRCAGTPP